ncbi:MAG TPA: type I pantothenate kinase [Nannocystis sp.]|jgi:type I pantothenate kinase
MRRSLFLDFDHEQWGRLRADTPMTLTEADLGRIRGLNESVSMHEVVQVYLPLSRLLNLHVAASQELYGATSTFLGHPESVRVPYIIGVAGSVAVGKSTTARLLRELLARWPNSPRVDLVTTDGFLLPNATLEARGLMHRKGFPESYDARSLLAFVADIKAGRVGVQSPVYSHESYDILPDQMITLGASDIVIIEGLNVLQTRTDPDAPQTFVSDYFDFSIYVDADPDDLERWYLERFLTLQRTAFRRPRAYFNRYAHLSEHEARTIAAGIWREINARNLRENILPTRERADLILEKSDDHSIRRVRLRKR